MSSKKPTKPSAKKAKVAPADDPKNADRICELLGEGVPLLQILREQAGMPGASAFYERLDEKSKFYDAELAGRIARARMRGHDALAAQCLKIADTPLEGVEITTDEKGISEKRGDMLGHRKLQIETRLKLLAKWDKRYGDKVIHAGDPENPLAFTEVRRTVVDPK